MDGDDAYPAVIETETTDFTDDTERIKMAFEIYNRKLKGWNRPIVSVTARGFSINPIAASELGLDRVPRVRLGYCRETNRIAMYPAAEDDSTAYRLILRSGGSRQIAAVGFVQTFGIAGFKGCELEYDKPEKGTNEIIFTFSDKKARFHEKRAQKLTGNAPKVKEETERCPDDFMPLTKKHKEFKPKRIEYECANCGYENPAWKYNKSMQPLGHPEVCPKCNGGCFVKLIKRKQI